jgi:hypothetical protein
MSKFTTLASLLNLPGFRPDLEGARTRGSTTEQGLKTLTDRPVSEFTPDAALTVPGARYFEFPASELGGRLGAITFEKAVANPETKALLRLRDAGDHGVDFYLDVEVSDADLPSAEIGVAIIGPINDEGDLGWWTWYVSDEETKVTGTAMARSAATGTPIKFIGVKLHNGS